MHDRRLTSATSAVVFLVAAGIGLAMSTSSAAETVLSPAPKIFAPGVISGPLHDSAPAFDALGSAVYFSRSTPAGSTILVSHMRGHAWSTPQIAPFSGEWSDMEPALTPDGATLVFVSNRPAERGGQALDGFFNGHKVAHGGGNLWRVRRVADGWSLPERLPATVNRSSSVFAPSLTADGSLYFMEPDASSGKFRLYRSQRRGGHYDAAQALPFSDGSATDVDPAVAPDESFLIFASGRAPARNMDLFIVFRDDAQWATPIHLGDVVNSAGSDAEARLGVDHRTLYFSSERTLPIALPHTPAQAITGLDRATRWDNGLYNIWQVSLAPWLDAHAQRIGMRKANEPAAD